MDNIQLKKAIAEHVEVLIQYTDNVQTDRELLKDMFVRIFCKFYKKEIFYTAVTLFNELKSGVNDPMMKWDVQLIDCLAATFPNNIEFPEAIVKEVKKFYKIK